MGLLDAPILFSLELHISREFRSRVWTTPTQLRQLTAPERLAIAKLIEVQVDHLFGELGVKRRLVEVLPTLTAAQARKVLE